MVLAWCCPSRLGHLDQAVGSFDRALALRSDQAEILFNRAIALRRLGRLEEALVNYDSALKLRPDYPEALNNRGFVLLELGRSEDALTSIDRALELRADYAGALTNRGNALSDLGRLNEALESYDQALKLHPEYAEALNNRGNALLKLKRIGEAFGNFSRAIAIKPEYAEALNGIGTTLRELQRLDASLECHNKAIAIKPDYAEAHNNRGITLRDLNQMEESLSSFDRAIALKPDYADAYSNRGNTLRDLNRLKESLASYDTAIALKPDDANPHWNKSLASLLIGDFASGWRCYEWRKFKDDPTGNREYAQPLWGAGESASGKRVLIHWEQGLGDTIQFCRYIPLLAQAGAKVLFAPQKPLRHLMRSLSPSIEIVDENAPTLNFDLHCPLLSLPLAFNTDRASIPNKTPYLSVDTGLIQRWRRRIGDHGFRIGICWQGGTTKIDAGRSFPLTVFGSISRIPDVRLLNLHKGIGESQLQSLPEGMKVETLGGDFDAGPDAFLDSAAVMKCCDLVITSDTAIAHLAGALAVPVWVALKYVPDWRWMLERSDSPWYPSARLFRQRSRDDWTGVLSDIGKELGVLTTNRS